MKRMLGMLLLLPLVAHAQSGMFDGVYQLPEMKDAKLKVWDTIRQGFTFAGDSVRYSYAVMRPSSVRLVATSVDYDEYGAWKAYRDTVLSLPDRQSGQPFSFKRTYIMFDNGSIAGYFQSAGAVDSVAGKNNETVFIRNGKVFRKVQAPVVLRKGN